MGVTVQREKAAECAAVHALREYAPRSEFAERLDCAAFPRFSQVLDLFGNSQRIQAADGIPQLLAGGAIPLRNNWLTVKWFKLLMGILLLPVCFGAVSALWMILRASGSADTIWVAILAGAGCWLAIFLLLPKPMRAYVFGHELTHALWVWLMGGRVKRFKVSSKGGQVVVTKNNFLIALAPYFFPLYAVMLVLVFLAGHLIWGWARYAVWFHLLLGAAYAFHVTLNWHALNSTQSDVTQHGYLFSGVIIFLGNIGVLLIAIPLLAAKVGVGTALAWWFHQTGEVVLRLTRLF